jgi:hypothetical protein
VLPLRTSNPLLLDEIGILVLIFYLSVFLSYIGNGIVVLVGLTTKNGMIKNKPSN